MREDRKFWIASNSQNHIQIVEGESMDEASKKSLDSNRFQRMETYNLVKRDGVTIVNSLYFQFSCGKFCVVNQYGSHVLKIEENSQFTYKFMKTKVKAVNGMAGLMDFILSNYKDLSSPFNGHLFHVLNEVGSPKKLN